MSESILLVEDEAMLREVAKDYFLSVGYQVFEAENGTRALQIFEKELIDLVVLDVMIPEIDGWSVCRRIRKRSDVPIIMLTARSDEEDTLMGFEMGADDYVTKPYRPRILLARVDRLLKNKMTAKKIPVGEHSNFGIEVDSSSRTVMIAGQMVKLTHIEFEILACLIENKGLVVTREQLIHHIWGMDAADDRTVNTHIRNLRHKLGDKSKYIKTVIRTGYKFGE